MSTEKCLHSGKTSRGIWHSSQPVGEGRGRLIFSYIIKVFPLNSVYLICNDLWLNVQSAVGSLFPLSLNTEREGGDC